MTLTTVGLKDRVCFDVFHGRNEATRWLTTAIL